MIVDRALYVDGERTEIRRLPEAVERSHADDAFLWIGMYEPTPDEFRQVTDAIALPGLAVDDALSANQRPKLEVYDGVLFLVVWPTHYHEEEERVDIGELMLFIGCDFVVTVRHGDVGELTGVRAGLEEDREWLRQGPAAVLHRMLDHVVDAYRPIARHLEIDVEQVEEEVFAGTGNPAPRIQGLMRQVLRFHRATSPLRSPLERLAAGSTPVVGSALKEHFRDIADHLISADDRMGSVHNLLESVLDSNLAQIGIRQNEDMRKISAWVAIAAVPTTIAAIYGMNFTVMPELSWRWGYPAVLLLMVGAGIGLFRAFRRNGWL